MEKLVCLPTQHYDRLSVWVGKILVLTLAVELDDIRGQKCNADQVIIFQTVILQHVRLVTGTKTIFA